MTKQKMADSMRAVRIGRHVAAAVVTAIPILLIVYVNIVNPGYYAHLISSDPHITALGLPLIVLMLLFLGLIYGCVILIANTYIALVREPKSGGKILWGVLKIVLLLVGLGLLLTFTFVLALLGPAGIILFTSPVGRMFFGR